MVFKNEIQISWMLRVPAVRVTGFALVISCIVGCGGPNTPSDNSSGSSPSLIGAYRFDIPQSTQPSSITVVFSGQLNQATAMAPETKFSVSQTVAVAIGPGKGSVSFSVSGLKSGTWTVTASPNGFGAPVKCDSVTVPGS